MGEEHIADFYPTTLDTFYQSYVPTGLSDFLYLGKNDERDIKALMRWSFLPDSGIVDTARMTIHINDVFGDVQGPMTVSVNAITALWEETEVTWETFDAGSIGEELLTFDIPVDVLLSVETDSVSVSFDMPLDFIQTWIDTATSENNFGFLLSMAAESAIIEIHSTETEAVQDLRPTLYFVLRHDTTTISHAMVPANDAFIGNFESEPTADYLLVGAGTVLRSYLVFDFDSIPEDATINRSILILHQNTELVFPDTSRNLGILAYPATDGASTIPYVPYDTLAWLAGVTAGDSILINITAFTQSWNDGSKDNHGLILRDQEERVSLLQHGFYSTTADSSLWPRLEIFYSLPPSQRYK